MNSWTGLPLMVGAPGRIWSAGPWFSCCPIPCGPLLGRSAGAAWAVALAPATLVLRCCSGSLDGDPRGCAAARGWAQLGGPGGGCWSPPAGVLCCCLRWLRVTRGPPPSLEGTGEGLLLGGVGTVVCEDSLGVVVVFVRPMAETKNSESRLTTDFVPQTKSMLCCYRQVRGRAGRRTHSVFDPSSTVT